MKGLQFTVSRAKLLEMLDLEDGELTGDSIMERISEIKEENISLSDKLSTTQKEVKKLRDVVNKNTELRIKAALAGGLEDGRINAEQGDILEKQYAGNPDGLEAWLGTMKPYQSIVKRLEGEKPTKFPTELEDKTFNDIHKLGRIVEVRENFPDKYKELYKKQFGKEPELKK